MSGSNVELSNGTTLPSDAVVFATGWVQSPPFFEPSLAMELGIPAPLQSQDASTEKYWQGVTNQAEKDLLTTYPILETAPDFYKKELTKTSFRLYRHIVPHSLVHNRNRSIIFLGMLSNLQFPIYAEVASLWGVAWMEGLLDDKTLPTSKEQIDYDIAKFNAWSALRYSSRGRVGMVAGGEIQDIIDLLMVDMGLEPHRKKYWLSDRFVTYRSQDYKGITQEFLDKARKVPSS